MEVLAGSSNKRAKSVEHKFSGNSMERDSDSDALVIDVSDFDSPQKKKKKPSERRKESAEERRFGKIVLCVPPVVENTEEPTDLSCKEHKPEANGINLRTVKNPSLERAEVEVISVKESSPESCQSDLPDVKDSPKSYVNIHPDEKLENGSENSYQASGSKQRRLFVEIPEETRRKLPRVFEESFERYRRQCEEIQAEELGDESEVKEEIDDDLASTCQITAGFFRFYFSNIFRCI